MNIFKKSKKLYAYENSEGDKGVIIATSLSEAIAIFKKNYPNRKVVDVDTNDYWDNGAYVFEVGVLNGKRKLFCPFLW